MQRPQDEVPGCTNPIGDLLVTGGTGFLGSQFMTGWLQKHRDASIACLIRGEDEAAVARRLRDALVGAGEDRASNDDTAGILARTCAIPAELSDLDWIGAVARWRSACGDRPFGVLHCAANLSFRPGDRDAVRLTNIGGTQTMLTAAERLGASEFNYVSTAYVAGNRNGDILEDETGDAPGFSNAYEESKWDAEALVRRFCTERGMAYRILRPSIIIAHSITHRLSALSGFYKVVETMLLLSRLERARGQTILLPLPEGATLDLIPVDVVVNEMIQVLEAGERSHGHAFHLTSDDPLSLIEVLGTLSPLAGLSIGRLDEAVPAGKLANLFMQRLRHYTPYLGQIRSFNRQNARAVGVARQGPLDVERLLPYVTTFLARAA